MMPIHWVYVRYSGALLVVALDLFVFADIKTTVMILLHDPIFQVSTVDAVENGHVTKLMSYYNTEINWYSFAFVCSRTGIYSL